MKKYLLVLVFALTTIFSCTQGQKNKEQKNEITTYYLIRHAEKNRNDTTDKDPSLTIEGSERATRWAEVLSNANINMVYTTNYNRTKETAQPTATKNGLELIMYNPSKMYEDVFKNNTKGKNVLIVGHSNTTAAFANTILGKDVFEEIADDNNSNLYIVTVTKDGTTGVLLKIDN